jgi:hypothetical protein
MKGRSRRKVSKKRTGDAVREKAIRHCDGIRSGRLTLKRLFALYPLHFLKSMGEQSAICGNFAAARA